MNPTHPLSQLSPDLIALLRTNNRPDHTQRQQLFQLNAAEFQEERGLLWALQACRTRRHAVATLLSPLRNLVFPAELLSMIFELVVSASDGLDGILQRKAVFNLCLVSIRWRDVCFATPTLWSQFGGVFIAMHAINQHLSPIAGIPFTWYERARGHPVEVDIFGSHPLPLQPMPLASPGSRRPQLTVAEAFILQHRPFQLTIKHLMHYAGQISSFWLRLTRGAIYAGLPESSDTSMLVLSALHTLKVNAESSGACSGAPLFSFLGILHAPQLKHLVLDAHSCLPDIRNITTKLETLQLNFLNEYVNSVYPKGNIFQTLQFCPCLTSLSLTAPYITVDVPQDTLVLPQLETLSLDMESFGDSIGAFLNHLACPDLKNLDIFLVENSDDSEMSVLQRFQKHSGFSLKKLVLRGLNEVSLYSVWTTIKTMDTLEELRVSRLQEGFDLLDDLCDSPLPLPRLHTLILTVWIESTDSSPNIEDEIKALVRSRWWTDDGARRTTARWREILVARDEYGLSEVEYGEIMSPETKENWQAYAKQGLKLDFDPYPDLDGEDEETRNI